MSVVRGRHTFPGVYQPGTSHRLRGGTVVVPFHRRGAIATLYAALASSWQSGVEEHESGVLGRQIDCLQISLALTPSWIKKIAH